MNTEWMMDKKSLTDYWISDHAREEMARRQITEEDVAQVLAAPEQVETVREGRRVYQSRLQWGDPPKVYLFVFSWMLIVLHQQRILSRMNCYRHGFCARCR